MDHKLISIVMVDDHDIIRNAYKKLLEGSGHFSVIADFGDGVKAIEEIIRLKPDIVLMDMNMAPLSGFTVTESIIKQDTGIKIIGLSVKNQPVYAKHLLQLGAKGFLTKTSTIEEIIDGILEVHHGNTYICREITNQMKEANNH